MRVVICDYAGHPFQVELSRSLARRGHSVLHLYFADLKAPKGELALMAGDSPNFHIQGIATGAGFDKGRFLRRRILEANERVPHRLPAVTNWAAHLTARRTS